MAGEDREAAVNEQVVGGLDAGGRSNSDQGEEANKLGLLDTWQQALWQRRGTRAQLLPASPECTAVIGPQLRGVLTCS